MPSSFQISAGDDYPVRRLPVASFQYAIHDRFLPFQPEGINRIHHIDSRGGSIDADLLDAANAVVKITPDLKRQSAVIQCLETSRTRSSPLPMKTIA